MQKIRRALEKIGKEKDFKFKDMNALKVTKYFMLKQNTQWELCLNYYIHVCGRLVQWRSSKVRRD